MEKLGVERSIWIKAPRERVWQAITIDQQIRKWWADYWAIPTLEVGATLKFGTEDNPILGTLAVVDPPRELAIQWPPQAQFYSLTTVTRYILEEEAGGTRITVSETGFETLPDIVRQQRIEQVGQGYTTVMQNLKTYVENTTMEQPIAIERNIWINAPRERVWQAVTDPAQIAQWFAPGAEFSVTDNKISVRMGEADVEVAFIEVVDPPHQITTRSLPDMISATTYKLVEENGGTRFTVIETGLEALSEEARQQRLTEGGQGWELTLANLKAFIDGQALPRPEGF